MNQMSFRNRSFPGKSALVAALCLSALVAGCDTLSDLNPFDGREKYKKELLVDAPPDRLYNEGLARLQKGDNEGAAKKFDEIDKVAPASSFSRQGLLLTAYSNYEIKKWDEAIAASRRFLAGNPNSNDAAYAQYILAMSYYGQIPDVTRDQERTERALLAMQELLERYPKSEYVADVREKMLVARDQLAGKEMGVGRFYLEQRNFSGAVNRFREVISKYQTTRHVEEALMRLTEAYMALGITSEAQTAAAVLGHNFPDSQWYKDAFTLLQSNGLEPREDQGSFISRTFRGFSRVVGLSR